MIDCFSFTGVFFHLFPVRRLLTLSDAIYPNNVQCLSKLDDGPRYQA
jgi:hypothetical protein